MGPTLDTSRKEVIEIDDRSFFDVLYQQWTRTTGAEDRYWMPEQVAPDVDGYHIYAVDEQHNKRAVTDESGLCEVDADFITAVHGCFGDLVKRLHSAVDEADRLDYEKDDLVNRVAVLELEADEMARAIESREAQIDALEVKLSDERGYSSYLQCDINDLKAEQDEFSSIIKDLTEKISELESGRV